MALTKEKQKTVYQTINDYHVNYGEQILDAIDSGLSFEGLSDDQKEALSLIVDSIYDDGYNDGYNQI